MLVVTTGGHVPVVDGCATLFKDLFKLEGSEQTLEAIDYFVGMLEDAVDEWVVAVYS